MGKGPKNIVPCLSASNVTLEAAATLEKRMKRGSLWVCHTLMNQAFQDAFARHQILHVQRLPQSGLYCRLLYLLFHF